MNKSVEAANVSAHINWPALTFLALRLMTDAHMFWLLLSLISQSEARKRTRHAITGIAFAYNPCPRMLALVTYRMWHLSYGAGSRKPTWISPEKT